MKPLVIIGLFILSTAVAHPQVYYKVIPITDCEAVGSFVDAVCHNDGSGLQLTVHLAQQTALLGISEDSACA